MDPRTGVRGRPAFGDAEQPFIKREGTGNIADCQLYVVDGQAANDGTGNAGAVLRAGIRRQYQCRQRLDQIATRDPTPIILIEQGINHGVH